MFIFSASCFWIATKSPALKSCISGSESGARSGCHVLCRWDEAHPLWRKWILSGDHKPLCEAAGTWSTLLSGSNAEWDPTTITGWGAQFPSELVALFSALCPSRGFISPLWGFVTYWWQWVLLRSGQHTRERRHKQWAQQGCKKKKEEQARGARWGAAAGVPKPGPPLILRRKLRLWNPSDRQDCSLSTRCPFLYDHG